MHGSYSFIGASQVMALGLLGSAGDPQEEEEREQEREGGRSREEEKRAGERKKEESVLRSGIKILSKFGLRSSLRSKV